MSRAVANGIARNGENIHAPNLLSWVFEKTPKAVNCTLLPQTKLIAGKPEHPYYIKIRRRLKAFDASRLHWTVRCPMDISNRALIRNWASNRVKQAFIRELRDAGWQSDGLPRPGASKDNLKGALLMILSKREKTLVLTATYDQVRDEVRRILDDIVERQAQDQPSTRRKHGSAVRPRMAKE